MLDNYAPSVRYTAADYMRLRETYRRWWSGGLDRPIVPIITRNHPSWRKESKAPSLCFETAWDFSISPKEFVDAADWQLSQLRFHGDAFPFFAPTRFGPGTLAAFLGCTPVGKKDTVWFQSPSKDIPIKELHFEMDTDNRYFRRVMDLYDAALEKWRGSVVLGMVDLGGVMDVLASFRGSENLLLDLYDSPEEVLRCVDEIQKVWFRYFDRINSVLAPEVMGYSQWFNIYSEAPGYILQSDFSYMIGPEMFNKFVGPELASSASRLHNALYHMDGIGQIPHLDSLLNIDGIKAIQWVPGAGTPESMNWDELLARILASGKKLISWTQKPDGRPIDIAADPGQLYFDDRYFDDIEDAKAYGDMFGIEVR